MIYFIYSSVCVCVCVCVQGFPGGTSGKEPPVGAGAVRGTDLIPALRGSPGGRAVFLPGESYG